AERATRGLSRRTASRAGAAARRPLARGARSLPPRARDRAAVTASLSASAPAWSAVAASPPLIQARLGSVAVYAGRQRTEPRGLGRHSRKSHRRRMEMFRPSRSLTVAFAALAVIAAAGSPAAASSHREAPAIAADPAIDATDLYAFVSPDRPDTVTLIANYVPLEAPYGGPNFFGFADWPSAQYEIKVDNNGDAVEDLTFLFQFRTETANDKTFLYNTGPITLASNGSKTPYAGLNVYQYYRVYLVRVPQKAGEKQ